MLIFRRIHCIHAAYGTVTLSTGEWSSVTRTNTRPLTCLESDSTICCMYTMCSPEDEHLWLATCRGIIFYK